MQNFLRIVILVVINTVFVRAQHGHQQEAVKISGSMHQVMQVGELFPTIDLDTIKTRTRLYGLGPVEYLRGEIMILDGKSYVSAVTAPSRMKVDSTFKAKAPFFVYTHVDAWDETTLPDSVIDDKSLENYLVKVGINLSKPFAFKISGSVVTAKIHVVNLPKGSAVKSSTDAHKGQVDFRVTNKSADVIGFFSMEHQGIFTHHSSYVHMHLLTRDKMLMGHVDALTLKKGAKIYLPRSK